MILFIIMTAIYLVGLGILVYRLGLPLGGSAQMVLFWVLFCALWPLSLLLTIIHNINQRL